MGLGVLRWLHTRTASGTAPTRPRTPKEVNMMTRKDPLIPEIQTYQCEAPEAKAARRA